MNALDRLEASNGATLGKLRNGEIDAQQLLVQLLTTSCLLEVSKLLSARVDVATFAPAALEVLTQFASVDSCAIRIEALDVPCARATMGEFPDAIEDELRQRSLAGAATASESADPALVVSTLSAGGAVVGYLAATNLAQPIADSELIEKVAEQISSGLDALLDAERARRKLAASKARDIAGRIDEKYSADDLDEFIKALAALPKAVGASLLLSNARLGGPIAAQSGVVGDGPMTSRAPEIDRQVTMSIDIYWSAEPDEGDLASFAESVDALAGVLSRLERALRLADEVETDELTLVGNRRRGLRVLSAARAWAEREDRCFSVLIMDLDYFKKVNDTLGHHAGDKVLAGFANMVKQSIREYDTVVRWGGEEFLVVCPDTDMYQAENLARRLLSLTPGSCCDALPEDWHQTVSIGIASYPMHGENPTVVVNAADAALYQSKEEGRNRSTIATLAANAKIVSGRSR